MIGPRRRPREGGGLARNAGRTRRVTIADIAVRAGVSKGAVSYALNGQPGVSDATRERIVATVNLGTPAEVPPRKPRQPASEFTTWVD